MKKARSLSYRQTRAIEFWLAGGRKSKAKALRKASYSEAMARQPHKVFNSPAVRSYLENGGLGTYGTRSSISPKEVPVEVNIERPQMAFDVSKIPPDQILWLKNALERTPDRPLRTKVYVSADGTTRTTHE